jgi:hypothetical protein
MGKKTELLLIEVKRFHRGSRNRRIFEYYKNKAGQLDPSEYEDYVRQLTEILGL